MFNVISKETGLKYTVYAVRDDEFLIFFKDHYDWFDSDLFRPVEKTELEQLIEEEKEQRKGMMFRSQQVGVSKRYLINP